MAKFEATPDNTTAIKNSSIIFRLGNIFMLVGIASLVCYSLTIYIDYTPLNVTKLNTFTSNNNTSISVPMNQNITNHPSEAPVSVLPIFHAAPDNHKIPYNITHLMKQRITMPVKCLNSTHNLINITPSDHNWAPFFFRCQYNQATTYPHYPWSNEAFITKELFYDHVFKAGGTTIQSSLTALARDDKLSLTAFPGEDYVISGGDIAGNSRITVNGTGKFHQNKILNEFLNDDAILFSFVRDPIDKFLSAFYEAHIRLFDDGESRDKIPRLSEYDDLTGLEIMRAWIDKILRNIKKEKGRVRKHELILAVPTMHDRKKWRRNFRKRLGGKRRRMLIDYVNSHLPPNMDFLMDKDWSMNIPFGFIGDLYNLKNDLPQVLMPLIIDEELKRNHSELMKYLATVRSRDGDNMRAELSKFIIGREELNKKDIDNLCQIYWLDYLCFPFDIPDECNLNKLYSDHYGTDLSYKNCY